MNSDLVRLYFLLISSLIFSYNKLIACICLPPTVEESYISIDEIFIGKAFLSDSIFVKVSKYSNLPLYSYEYTLLVELKFKGNKKSKFTYWTNFDSCKINSFTPNKKYLFYVNYLKGSKSEVIVSDCQRTVCEIVSPRYRKYIHKTEYLSDLEKLYKLNPKPKKYSNQKYIRILFITLIIIIIVFILGRLLLKKSLRSQTTSAH